MSDPIHDYQKRKERISVLLKNAAGQVRFRKKTSSNLFRYRRTANELGIEIPLGEFDNVLAIDRDSRTLNAEGLITFEQLVTFTLAHGFLPPVAPELKHITLAGATVGIGIESSCFRYGFVHDSLLEADVLLPKGQILTCNPENDYADLFFGLPNSYGTLGYILRGKIKLIPAKPYVKIDTRRHDSLHGYLQAMEQATKEPDIDFVEGLFYQGDEFYLTTGRMVSQAPSIEDIYHKNIFYKMLRGESRFYLSTLDYIFRYDPDWFWNLPEGGFYDLFRRFAPRSMRSSGFYSRYTSTKHRLKRLFGRARQTGLEQLIQDWELPWEHAAEFTRFALDNVDLKDLPWVGAPIYTPHSPTNYPVRPNSLYFNVGCYCHTPKPKQDTDYYYTRILDDKCFDLGGIKMLYSSSFLSRDEFHRIYNGAGYEQLKQKYDPEYHFGDLYDKCVGKS